MPFLRPPRPTQKPTVQLLIILLLVSAQAAANGAPSTAGAISANTAQWYLSPKLIGGATRIGRTPDRGQIGTGALIDGLRDGAIPADESWDSSAAAGLGMGYRRGRWRLEFEFAWHFRSDWDLSVPTPSIATVTNLFTNVERATYLLGANYLQPLGAKWHWELGAGVGVVTNKLRTDYKERAVPDGSPAFLRKSSDSQRGFAFSLQTGITRQLSPRWQVAAYYQHLDTGKVHIGPIEDRGSRFQTDITDHLLVLSLRYRLR